MPKQCKHPDCNYPVFSHEYCGRHQHLRTDGKWLRSVQKKKEKIMNKSYSSIKQKSKEPTGEAEMFQSIWDTRKHISWLTGTDINQFEYNNFGELVKHPLWINLFHHPLNKKNYSRYRLNPDNIILLLPQEHLDIHSLGRDKLEEKYGKENIERYYTLVEKLKSEYNET
jgi:hypothetical protein